MTAEIIQFIPKPNPNREKRELEKEAARVPVLESTQIMVPFSESCCGFIEVPFGGQGIDGMTFSDNDPA